MRGIPLLALLCVGGAAAQIIPGYDRLPDPNEYGPCEGIEAMLFATLPSGLENLHFLDGSLYLTAFGEGLYRAWPNGTFDLVLSEPQPSSATPLGGPRFMMGLASHGGDLFVAQGQSVVEPVPARILRFDEPGSPEYSVFADGFDGVNGMVADGQGNLYVAHGFREGLYKVTPNGQWSLWLDLPTVNGVDLHPSGDRIVVAQVADTGSHVVAVSLADPQQREVMFQFNAVDAAAGADPGKALVAKLVDDLTVHPDGRVFVASHERLQTLMGDPASDQACILKGDHGASPTSVRLASGFGDWDGWLFSTDGAGEVWAFDVRPDAEKTTPPPGDAGSDRTRKSTPLGPAIVPVALALAVAWTRRGERA
jgi:hypothetical protein